MRDTPQYLICCDFSRMYVCMYVYRYTYTYMNTHPPTHTHTHIHAVFDLRRLFTRLQLGKYLAGAHVAQREPLERFQCLPPRRAPACTHKDTETDTDTDTRHTQTRARAHTHTTAHKHRHAGMQIRFQSRHFRACAKCEHGRTAGRGAMGGERSRQGAVREDMTRTPRSVRRPGAPWSAPARAAAGVRELHA